LRTPGKEAARTLMLVRAPRTIEVKAVRRKTNLIDREPEAVTRALPSRRRRAPG
jgi:hypothetical protein